MWTYIPEYLRYTWCYVQLAWAMYVRPMLKSKKPSVSSDTKED